MLVAAALVTLATLSAPAAPAPAPPQALPTGSASEVRPADLSRYQGDVVVVSFMASWCGACRSSIPTLNRWAERYGPRGAHVVGISRESVSLLERYREEAGIEFELTHDAGGALSVQYEVRALPTFLVLDRDGEVRGRFKGAGGTLKRISALVESLLGDSGGPTFGPYPQLR